MKTFRAWAKANINLISFASAMFLTLVWLLSIVFACAVGTTIPFTSTRAFILSSSGAMVGQVFGIGLFFVTFVLVGGGISYLVADSLFFKPKRKREFNEDELSEAANAANRLADLSDEDIIGIAVSLYALREAEEEKHG
jgi:hypothetical protein